MTVKELIDELSKYEPDTMVVISGYEGGYAELKLITAIELKLDVYRPADFDDVVSEAYRLNSCRGPHENIEAANRLEERIITKKSAWGEDTENFNFNGKIVRAVFLPRLGWE